MSAILTSTLTFWFCGTRCQVMESAEMPVVPGFLWGGPPGIRTLNLRIKSPLLCR